MVTKTLDILGQVCPYAALSAKKEIDKMKSGDILVVNVDCPPAATETIPEIARIAGIEVQTRKVGSGNWELTLTKK